MDGWMDGGEEFPLRNADVANIADVVVDIGRQLPEMDRSPQRMHFYPFHLHLPLPLPPPPLPRN